jgi:hypothetical protein
VRISDRLPLGVEREGTGLTERVRENGSVLHLRLIVPPEMTVEVVEELESTPGVVHVVRYACVVT